MFGNQIIGNKEIAESKLSYEWGSVSLSVDVSDPDGDAMDVSFYDSSDDSLIGTDSGVADGGTASVTWSVLYDTTYNWYAIADDGYNTTQSSTWSFTTETAALPITIDGTQVTSVTIDGTEATGLTIDGTTVF